HGLKIARAADAGGITPKEQADRTSARFKEAWELLDISYDRFIRTTDTDHHVAVQAFLQKIHDNGHLYKETYAGWYCVACEAYYEPEDLDVYEGDGPDLCKIHGRPVEWFEEDNWFFKLSQFEQPLLDWYDEFPDAVSPRGKRNEALGLIKGGLKDISITRTSIDWGVPVPWDDGHVFYVWYDALINYATAIGYGSDPERFAKWWPHVHHLLAKDILRFHCVYWPAMLMAAGEQPPAHLDVHGYLLVGGEKMSKTRLNQIFPADLVKDFGVDGFRFHFLRNAPFGPDGDVSYEGITAGYNADLANNFGNLLSRVATVVGKKCGGIGPAPRPDSPLAAVAEEVYRETAAAWDNVQPSLALEATWRLIREANALLENTEPWKAEPGPEVDGVLGDALEVLRLVCILASPALTRATEIAWERIGLTGSPTDQRLPESALWGGYPGGLTVTKGDPLFPRLKS
ncbi:MAG: methionine--tRNA ligase, partial [Acidimicrobiales bacterium]|nr:methionine--tRNA ligase [Acidimicrobiales bacterium]